MGHAENRFLFSSFFAESQGSWGHPWLSCLCACRPVAVPYGNRLASELRGVTGRAKRCPLTCHPSRQWRAEIPIPALKAVVEIPGE
jgi:hypothetical protein